MKKRVLRVFRPIPDFYLPLYYYNAYCMAPKNLDCWFGWEWIMEPDQVGLPSYYHVEEFLGQANTSPSYLHRYNKNDFYHECYYGEIYLDGVVQTNIPASKALQQAREIFGVGGLRVFYPTVASTGERFQLYLGSPTIGNLSVWKHPYQSRYIFQGLYPDDSGNMHYYLNYAITSAAKAKSLYDEFKDGYAPSYSKKWQKVDLIIKTTEIPSPGSFPLYGPEYWSLYKYAGLDGALSNAASSADGFHFSRLAGEIAMDGLVIQTIASLAQRADKSIRKAGPLASKLKTCFKLLPSVYLAYQYGVSAPIREYMSLPGALENHFNDIGPLVGTHSRVFDGFSVNSRVSLNIGSPSSSRQAANLAFLARGGLSLDDIWELVPLSFVVDWFLNVSALMESGRASQIYSELPVKSATFSTSFERDVPLPEKTHGSIHHRCYMREYLQGSSLPAEVFSFSLSDFRGTLSLQNVDEGIALILSYLYN